MTELQAKLEKSLQTSRASLATGNAMDESNPTPAAGNPKPIYPKIAIRRGIEGDVSLRVMLTASGVVSSVTVEKPSGSSLLDAAAVSAVKQWQFNPAMHQGEPAASVTTVPIEFKLIQSRG
jgi:protein TonB